MMNDKEGKTYLEILSELKGYTINEVRECIDLPTEIIEYKDIKVVNFKGFYFECQKCGKCCSIDNINIFGDEKYLFNEEDLDCIQEKSHNKMFTYYNINKKPCPKLVNNRCSIYNCRPEVCKVFPYFNSPQDPSIISFAVVKNLDCRGFFIGYKKVSDEILERLYQSHKKTKNELIKELGITEENYKKRLRMIKIRFFMENSNPIIKKMFSELSEEEKQKYIYKMMDIEDKIPNEVHEEFSKLSDEERNILLKKLTGINNDIL